MFYFTCNHGLTDAAESTTAVTDRQVSQCQLLETEDLGDVLQPSNTDTLTYRHTH